MDEREHMDYIFVVRSMLESCRAEYLIECKRLEKNYAKRKEMLKSICRRRGLSEVEIEQLFKNY